VLKSLHGIPLPVYPRGVDLKKEARTARRRFYPVTVLYTSYALAVLGVALRSRPFGTLRYAAFGVALFSWAEYMVHRYVLHGRFPDGEGWLRHALHRFFDTMHGDHHLRPWDGLYINGFLDSLPFAIVLALASFRFALHTAPVVVAVLLECYVIEEWVHYSVHFHRFRGRYFEYIRRHHLYHHSPRGARVAFGLTSGLWDAATTTRIPLEERMLLYGRGGLRAPTEDPSPLR
jgi:sterol desaturase/sphingolipid hydroxylase (fatty acid hydroxylase superfamily)